MNKSSAQAAQFAQAPRQVRKFAVYAANFGSLAAAAAAEQTIQILADSHFELQKLSFFTDLAGAAQTQSSRVLPLQTIQITDTGTGEQLFNIPVPIPAIMGDGQIPFILPTTRVFDPSAAIIVSLTNYSAATAYLTRILLIGAKIYKYG